MKEMNDVKTDILQEEKKFYDLRNEERLKELENENPEDLKRL